VLHSLQHILRPRVTYSAFHKRHYESLWIVNDSESLAFPAEANVSAHRVPTIIFDTYYDLIHSFALAWVVLLGQSTRDFSTKETGSPLTDLTGVCHSAAAPHDPYTTRAGSALSAQRSGLRPQVRNSPAYVNLEECWARVCLGALQIFDQGPYFSVLPWCDPSCNQRTS
jgi:hypothetical protein